MIVVIHGNYEFEQYPLPAHRRLAKMLIDIDVYSIIFHHSHIVSPIERYKGRTIAYSLSNWAFHYGRFFNCKLSFSQESFHQIAVELSSDGDVVHYARFEPTSTIFHQFTERVDTDTFSLRPVFERYSDKEYAAWFRANRVKRKSLPIYLDAEDLFSNHLRDQWVDLRLVLIGLAAKHGLKAIRRNH